MRFTWKPEKNEWLKENREICFETLVDAIKDGLLIRIRKYKGKKSIYQDQRIMVIYLAGKYWHVPCKAVEHGVFLRTAYTKETV